MTARIVRMVMVVLTAFIASIVIPEFYRTSFQRNVNYVTLNYSEVTKQFVIWGLEKEMLTDTLGNRYSRQEYERMVPFSCMPQLMKRGEFPDTVDGVAVNPQLVSENNYRHIVYLNERGRYYATMPLTHGGTDRAGFIYSNDMMRVNAQGIEFYNCETNKVDQEKSKMFDRELRALGYAPPAKKLYGVYAAAKQRDDGLFFVDSQNRLFQVKYYAYKPVCRKIDLPEGMKVRKMECINSHPEVVAYLFGDRNEVYILTTDDRMVKLDMDNFEYDKFKVFDMMGNLFYRMVSIQRDGYEKLFVFDREYKLVDSYALGSEVYEKTAAGIAEHYLFPFITSTYSYVNGYDIHTSWAKVGQFIWLNLFWAALLFYIKYRKRLNIRNPFHILNLLIVLATGVFGFLGALIYPLRK